MTQRDVKGKFGLVFLTPSRRRSPFDRSFPPDQRPSLLRVCSSWNIIAEIGDACFDQFVNLIEHGSKVSETTLRFVNKLERCLCSTCQYSHGRLNSAILKTDPHHKYQFTFQRKKENRYFFSSKLASYLASAALSTLLAKAVSYKAN